MYTENGTVHAKELYISNTVPIEMGSYFTHKRNTTAE